MVSSVYNVCFSALAVLYYCVRDDTVYVPLRPQMYSVCPFEDFGGKTVSCQVSETPWSSLKNTDSDV